MNSFETITLDRIDLADRRFCISYPLSDPLLRESIAMVDIVTPVILLEGPPFSIIAGFKRVEAAHDLGLTSVPAMVTGIGDEKEALLRAVHDNLARGLNTVEKALALGKMAAMGFPEEELYAVMPLLGLAAHRKMLSAFLSIARTEEKFKAFILAKSLSLTNIEGLMRFEPAERSRLMDILSSVHTTEGYMRDVLRMAALEKLKAGSIDFDALSGLKNGDDLRRRLKTRIHPGLLSLEEKLVVLKHRSALPPHVDIKVDPFFEKEYIDISIRARTAGDVEHGLEILRRILDNGSLEDILELTKG